MNAEQEKRYKKVFVKEFFLLNYKYDELIVSGSTKSLYKIKLKNISSDVVVFI
jgi:hypothetical protein